MSFIYPEIYKYLQELSNKINELYNINPRIYIVYSKENTSIEGSCMPAYRKDRIYLEVIIPHTYKTFGKKHQVEVASTLIHEYGHYLTEITLKGKERVESSREYEQSQRKRKYNEQSNWTLTKKLAKQLGLWNKLFFKVCKESYYTSNLKFD